MACLIARNGIYYAIFRHHGKQVWRSTFSKDREAALKVMEDLSKQFVNWRAMTILKLRDELAMLMKGQNSPATIELYDISLRQFAEMIGDKLLRAVTPYDIELFKSKRLQQVHPATVSMNFRTLKSAFNSAVRLGMIKENPFKGLRNVAVPEREPLFLSPEAIRRLVQATDDAQLKAIIIFAVCTAMRLGEIMSLKWKENVDLERGFVHLKNTSGFVLKTRRRRSVPLNSTAMSILTSLKRHSEYVFCYENGQPMRGVQVSRRFKRCVRKARLPNEIHFHTLRHTGASLLVQQNVPLAYVQKIFGHSTVRTTEIYSHFTMDHLHESVARLDSLIPSGILDIRNSDADLPTQDKEPRPY